MNMEDFVTYEQAVALKVLGFKEECFYHYNYNNQDNVTPNNDISHLAISANDFKISYNELGFYDRICYDAPTLAQAQAWLRNEKKISVEPWSCYTGGWNCTIKILPEEINYNITSKPSDNWLDIDKDYNSYEEALSDGITECFKCLEND